MSRKPRTFEEACDEIFSELRALLISKQRDYGHDNVMGFGLLGILIRMHDKMARLRNLWRKDRLDSPEHESVDDSLRDMANYAVIGLMLRRGTFILPLAEDVKPDAKV